MRFEHLFEPDLAQSSYLIGCPTTGTAIVVDPRRDVEAYLALAATHGLTITDVTETHVHADYLSGSRELAARTDAVLHLSAEGGPDWRYGFDGRPLYDGDEIRVGNVVLHAVHTPGHTPEHMTFLVTDGAVSDAPSHALTGDFVFVGDLGRPDLLDEAAGGVDTRFEGAAQMFHSLRERLLPLPEWIQIWPGHGAGSACGRALGAVASTTLGYERRVAWWRDAVERGDEAAFTRALLADQPDAPSYFGRMKRLNRDGPPLREVEGPPPRLDARAVADRLAAGEVTVIDTRAREAWERDAIEGAIHVPYGRKFATYAAWAIDPEADPTPLVVLADDAEQADELRDKLSWTGLDALEGYVDTPEPFPRAPVPTIAPAELARDPDAVILDVRAASEHAVGRVPGSTQLHAGQLRARLDEVPEDRPVVVHCESGARAAVAASLLRARGYDRVRELEGSYLGWRAWAEEAPAAQGEAGPNALR